MSTIEVFKLLTGKFGGRYQLASQCAFRTTCPRCPQEERLQPKHWRHRHIIRVR